MKFVKQVYKYRYLILAFFAVMWVPAVIMKGEVKNFFLQRNYEITKGVVIDEKNFFPNDYVKFNFTYSYEFEVSGNVYREDSHVKGLSVGDSVKIKYVPSYPNFNKLISEN